MVGTASAQDVSANDTEEADVTVGVSETIAVDIQPASMDFPGAVVGNRNTTSDRGFGAIEVENTGSVYIDRVWINSSTPASDPFGTGTASSYDAGNFLEVRPQDAFDNAVSGGNADSDNWHFINRQEYNVRPGDSSFPSFIQLPTSESNYDVGSFKRGNESIYYAIGHSGSCTDSGTVYVGNVSSTDNRLGTVDFTTSTEYGWTSYNVQTVTSDQSYGIAGASVADTGGNAAASEDDLTAGQGVTLNWTYTNNDQLDYDVLTNCGSDPNTVRTRYNANAVGADDLDSASGATDYLLDAVSTSGDMIYPGETNTIQTAINVPEGVTAGDVSPGTLRVLITADPDAN